MIIITADCERLNDAESDLTVDFKSDTKDAIFELAAIIATAIYKAKDLDISEKVATVTQNLCADLDRRSVIRDRYEGLQ